MRAAAKLLCYYQVGFQNLTFLGYELGREVLHPTAEMIEKIQRADASCDGIGCNGWPSLISSVCIFIYLSIYIYI